MTGKGHRITALAFGGFLFTLLATGHLVTPYESKPIEFIGLAWFVGILFGASAPDWLEIPIYTKTSRHSLIKHRTLTHWPPVWIAIGWYVWEKNLPWYMESFAFGFIAAALLHIATDALSKSGVPVLLPLSRFRWRIPFYTTGKFSESIALLLIVLLFSSGSFLLFDSA
jgi:membrane-bound metal-dependent hydrolase YbcI (DUF457 family)